jgi:hypothetical protein
MILILYNQNVIWITLSIIFYNKHTGIRSSSIFSTFIRFYDICHKCIINKIVYYNIGRERVRAVYNACLIH